MKILKVIGALLIFSIIFPASAFAQLNKVPNLKLYDFDRLHFGFTLVANQMDFVLKPKDNLYQTYFDSLPPDNDLAGAFASKVYGIRANPSTGFAVGIVGDLRLGDYFNLRFIPTLSFGRRELVYDLLLYDEQGTFKSERFVTKKINSTFVEFPFLLKYKSMRVHNMRAYVTGGIKFSFDLASEAHKDEKSNYDPKLYRTDTYGVIGAGLDFYMNWFKFGVELTMSYGTRDLLLREDNLYTDGIESLRSKIFMLTFTFE
ncbi:MAG: PorT family protein [Bacteroidales bacterium]|nr:PorT family protein [Bacteroidales bacterium]